MAQLIMSLRDKYAAITVASVLLQDRIIGLEPGKDKDQLEYLRDVLLELQATYGSELNLQQQAVPKDREMQADLGSQINLGEAHMKSETKSDESTKPSSIII